MPADEFDEDELGSEIDDPPEELEDAIDELLETDLMDNYGVQFANVLYRLREDGGGGGVPAGSVILWSGSISDIPDGWTLCDGTDGAPDLTNRFVVGAGDEYDVDETGGEREVKLTVDELASHSHESGDSTVDTWNRSEDTQNNSYNQPSDGYPSDAIRVSNNGRATSARYHMWSESQSIDVDLDETGGDEPHENRPPYYALAYIMKL